MPTDPSLSVVIVDDHAVVRRGVRALLDREPCFDVVAEAGDVAGALAAVREHRPAVLVLDIHLPGEPTLPAIGKVARISPGTRVLVLTMYDDPMFARHAIAAGAAGYVLKEAAPVELIAALHMVATGGSYVHPSLGARLAAGPEGRLGLDALSDREREVFLRVVRGATNRQIGAALHLSVRTVETHRARMQEKLGVSGLLDLAELARHHGLLDA